MKMKTPSLSLVRRLLDDPRIRHWSSADEGWTVYAVEDALSVLAETADAAGLWHHLRRRSPELEGLYQSLTFDGGAAVDVMDTEGILHLATLAPGRRAARLRAWMAQGGAERLAEDDDPELAVLRTRESYARRGHTRRWIDQRLRSVSGRHELTRGWYRRGARASDDFRSLTNELMHQCFGMDVEQFRRSRSLGSTRANLRDHLTDLELALVSLGESVAAALHRQRNSQGMDELMRDIRDAGRIIADTRRGMEAQLGEPIQRAPQAA